MSTATRPSGQPGRWVPRPHAQPRNVGRLLSLRAALEARVRTNPRLRRWLVDQFHRLYYELEDTTWKNTYWRGTMVAKTPLDLWLYQELVHELAPDLILETGTYNGGSAVFFGDLLEMRGDGRVVSIDLDTDTRYPEHDRVTYISGSSVSEEVLALVRPLVADADRVVVILDSDHAAYHVRAELDAYADFVTPGSYLVVEDGNINGHPVEPDFGPGPLEALAEWLPDHPEFKPDAKFEKFLFSFNAGGWLKRE